MAIQAVQGNSAVFQTELQSSAASKQPPQPTASTLPQDRVTISAAALAKSSGGDKDHDNDSK